MKNWLGSLCLLVALVLNASAHTYIVNSVATPGSGSAFLSTAVCGDAIGATNMNTEPDGKR
ncbi:MAG: hypothetical protein ABI540_02900 [Spartobacteria bacterium]